MLEQALQRNVAFVPGAPFYAANPCRNFLRLNFSNSPTEKIREGISRISEALKQFME